MVAQNTAFLPKRTSFITDKQFTRWETGTALEATDLGVKIRKENGFCFETSWKLIEFVWGQDWAFLTAVQCRSPQQTADSALLPCPTAGRRQ
jgi:hypothetical protein